MRRSGPLRRTTSLTARVGLKRSPLRASREARDRAEAHQDRMAELRPVVFGRAGWRCEACGRTDHPPWHLEAHHRLPRSAGGPDTPENLTVLCAASQGPPGCHQQVHAYPAWGYTVGLLVRRSSGPPSEEWVIPPEGLPSPTHPDYIRSTITDTGDGG